MKRWQFQIIRYSARRIAERFFYIVETACDRQRRKRLRGRRDSRKSFSSNRGFASHVGFCSPRPLKRYLRRRRSHSESAGLKAFPRIGGRLREPFQQAKAYAIRFPSSWKCGCGIGRCRFRGTAPRASTGHSVALNPSQKNEPE